MGQVASTGMTSEGLHPRERWLEDWAVGDSFVGEITYVMEHDRMIEFAEEFDPQSFHTDPQAASESFFGGLVASGWHTAAACMRLVADFLGPASMGAPGIDELRWHRPVRDGDELRLTWTVLEHRRSASKPDRGIMRVQQQVHDQAGELVMSMIAIMMIASRSDAPN